MGGHVQAQSQSVYLLQGWNGDEEEEIDIESSGESDYEGFHSIKKHGNKSDVGLSGAEQEHQTISHATRGLVESSGLRNGIGKERLSNSQQGNSNSGKRLDARRFRNHFASKFVTSKKSNGSKGNQQGVTGSTCVGNSVGSSDIQPCERDALQQAGRDAVQSRSVEIDQSKGKHLQQAGPNAWKASLAESDEEAVMLHVNLEVFTRKRKQASEASTPVRMNEKESNQTGNSVDTETVAEGSSSKDLEDKSNTLPESAKLCNIHGRSKRSRKLNRQTDYIPWSDFGRISSKKSEFHKSEMCSSKVPQPEMETKQARSKCAPEVTIENSVGSFSRETRVSAHHSSSEDMIQADHNDHKVTGSSHSISIVEKEQQSQVLTVKSTLAVQPSIDKQEVHGNISPLSSTVEENDKHHDDEVDGPDMHDRTVSICDTLNGVKDSEKAGSSNRNDVVHSNMKISQQDIENHCDPRAHEQRICGKEVHLRKEPDLPLKEVTESVPHSPCDEIDGLESTLAVAKDDHDSVCHKCRREGKLICCDGKGCKVTYHIDCLDPPLRDVPPNDWYCPLCAYKRIFGGMHLVSKGIESIWNVKVPNHSVGDGIMQTKAGVVKQAEVQHDMPNHHTASIHSIQSSQINSTNSFSTEKLYFVKYKGVAHAHNLWIGESQVSKEAPKLLATFKKQVEQGKVPLWDPEWSRPFRIIGRRETMLARISDVFPGHNDGGAMDRCVEWCVKWTNLDYDACTWEPTDKPPLNNAFSKRLIEEYEMRSAKLTLQRSSKERCGVKAACNPKGLLANMDADQQSLSQAIDKLMTFWQKQTNSVAINEVHQDRMKLAVCFLFHLLEKVQVPKPCLVVVSPTLLGEWKAVFRKWIPSINMVVYAGSKEARRIIQRYEFYNEEGLCVVEIILTSFDSLNLEMEALKDLSFEALVVDEFQRLKGNKASKSVTQFKTSYRLLLLSEPIKHTAEDFRYLLQHVSGEKDVTSHDDSVSLVQLRTLVSRHIVQEAKQELCSPREYWIPVRMTSFQLEQYCRLLVEKYELLTRGKRGDIVSSPQELLLRIRECCNHPFLVKPGYQESLTNMSAKQLLEFGIAASGKLKLLDIMLSEAKSSNKRVLILTQVNLRAGKVSQMDVLDDFMRQQFGSDSYERLDGGVDKSKKAAAVQRFNALNSKCFVFLLDRRASGSSLKLNSVDCIVIFDSDWNPQTDIQALLRMYTIPDLERMMICRLYCTQTIEERVLVSARRHHGLDSNHHNFTTTLCQKLLRWGAPRNFEILDSLSQDKSKEKSNDEILYSPEVISLFLKKGDFKSTDELCADNGLWKTALFPRRGNQYNKGIPLYGETDDEITGEDRVSAAEFWTELLKDRQIEAVDVQGRELRTRKKVQYQEDNFDTINTLQAAGDEEEESRRKRRRVADSDDLSTPGKVGRSTSMERTPTSGVEGDNYIVPGENVGGLHAGQSLDGVDKGAPQQPSSNNIRTSQAPSAVEKGNARNMSNFRMQHGEPESSENGAMNEPATGVKSSQQQVLLNMKADLDKLCHALQFQADTVGHVDQLLFSVGNYFKLPKEKSLLHAVELSLCWLAAEQQHYSIDRRATLSLAERCFGVQLDKIDTVHAKLEELWKKRLQQGVQQPQIARGQEVTRLQSGDHDQDSRPQSQEPPRDPQMARAQEVACVQGGDHDRDTRPQSQEPARDPQMARGQGVTRLQGGDHDRDTRPQSQEPARDPQMERGQEVTPLQGGEHDRDIRPQSQEPPRDQLPDSSCSMQGSHLIGQEPLVQRDLQLPKEAPTMPLTSAQHHRSTSSSEPCPSATASEDQISKNQTQVPGVVQEAVLPEASTDAQRVSLSQRSDRLNTVINAQKNQIAALDMAERMCKQRLRQHFDASISKCSRSNLEKSKLVSGLKSAFSQLGYCFKALRSNLIKQQYEERGRENRSANAQLGRESATEDLQRKDVDLSEEGILSCLPQGLRVAIETGNFDSAHTTADVDWTTICLPYAGSSLVIPPLCNQAHSSSDTHTVSLNMTTGISTTVSPCQSGAGLQDSQMPTMSNLQQQRHHQLGQAQDILLQQQRQSTAIAKDPAYSQGILSSSTPHSQQQAHQQHMSSQRPSSPVPVQQQSRLISTQRPTSPVPVHQPEGLSQNTVLTQPAQLVQEVQQSQYLQRGPSFQSRTGHQQSEIGQTSAVSGTPNVPLNLHRTALTTSHAVSRAPQSGQPRSNQQYHNDPLAQEYLRLRKEQEKLKSSHESEKERIKAQFMKELEILSKKYEVMLQEEESCYTQKASSIESNLKKVEMNRRLAEVFRLKSAQENSAATSIATGQDPRSVSVQGQNNPPFMVLRMPLTSAAAPSVQASPLYERSPRVHPQLVGTMANQSRYSQGPTSSTASPISSQALNLSSHTSVPVGEPRSVSGTSAPSSHIEPMRISALPSTSTIISAQRLSVPISNAVPNVTTGNSGTMSDHHGLNMAAISSYIRGASNHGNGTAGTSTSNFQAYVNSNTPLVFTSSTTHNSTLIPGVRALASFQQDSSRPSLGFSETSGNAGERPNCDPVNRGRPNSPMSNNEVLQANSNRCVISPPANQVVSNLETFNAMASQSRSPHSLALSSLGSVQSRHSNEGQDHRSSDVICLSDDD
ncbi:hypothetical protein KP509_07G083100 [Ceratopteris richardii]|uniref:Uncharacterized protein n=2 Tax=Ceratopteris richardii TaxID=49495 RepID=A0A8T2UN73_CERRI|nr:hypothetical protein KP509_07G083100 [Ceratopteris richardii]